MLLYESGKWIFTKYEVFTGLINCSFDEDVSLCLRKAL
jgi:hypothetical protein